jgi:hypothetical protein
VRSDLSETEFNKECKDNKESRYISFGAYRRVSVYEPIMA